MGEEKEHSGQQSKLPFPRATVTNRLRENLDKGKQITGQVKDEMNLWLGRMIQRVARKMNAQPYTFVNYDMLKEAIAPYEEIQNIDKERESLIKGLERIKSDCDGLIDEIDKSARKRVSSLKLEGEPSFPRATITNKLRENLDKGKQIKGPVKKGLNIWAGTLVKRVAEKMNSYPYNYVDGGMFREAIESYESVGEIEMEKERIIKQLDALKLSCDVLISEIERKFVK
jgi:cytochrome oxidase assembly protein ShyY1